MELTRRTLAVALGGAALAAQKLASAQATGASSGASAAPAAGPGQVPHPQKAADVTRPAAGMALHPAYVRTVAAYAYMWGWPLVNMRNRRTTFENAPAPGLLNGILPVAPTGQVGMLHGYVDPAENFVTCPNQDVVYGLGFFSLDKQPVIAQVPDFGERFWVYALYDGRTDQFAELGKPYKTKPGFYLLVGPNWKGEKPDGVEAVIRSSTEMANAIPRIFMDDTPEDLKAVQTPLNQVVFYPLDKFDGKMKSIDWANAPHFPGPKTNGEETKWVVPEKFFDQLGAVLENVSPLPGEEALYAQFAQLLEAGKNDAATRKIMVDTAIKTEAELIKPFFQWKNNGRTAGNGWFRSTNNAQWGVDYYNRTGTSKSNMFDNKPTETQYFYTDNDSSGKALSGAGTYAVTFPKGQEPPVNGFWSLTLYNDKHLFNPNRLKRYSLGTKNKNLLRNPDGSLTLYAGAKSPGKDKEANWLPAPQGTFSLYIRAYWGQQPILDGSWKPPVIRKIA